MSRSTARQYLETFQKQRYAALGLSLPPRQEVESLVLPDFQKLAALFAPTNQKEKTETWTRRKVEELLALLKDSPPTAYEKLPDYLNILFVANRLENAARKSAGRVVLTRPIFGTVPGGAVNALTLLHGSEYIVVFSSGLFDFAAFVARSVAKALKYSGVKNNVRLGPPEQLFVEISCTPDDIRESLERDPKARQNFIEVILSYIRWGCTNVLNAPELDPQAEVVANVIEQSFVEFVVAHEYGHIYHKHLLDPAARGEPRAGTSAYPMMWDWRKEVEADVAACALMMGGATTGPTNLPAALMGIEVFLTCYEIVDRALSLLCVGDEDHWVTKVGHPAARARRGFLHSHLISRCHEFLEGPDAEVQMRSALSRATLVSQVVEALWEHARPCLWRSYELGWNAHVTFDRISDATDPYAPAILGGIREQLKEVLPGVHRPFGKGEQLVVAGKRLIRSCARALFDEEPEKDMTQNTLSEAQTAIRAALTGLGQALGSGIEAMAELRPVLVKVVEMTPDLFQVALDHIALGVARLEAAATSDANATTLWEGGRFIHEAGQSLSAMGEMSGVGVHLTQMGEYLGLGSEALARSKTRAFWMAMKLAGSMAVLSGECLIRGAVAIWQSRLPAMIGAALLPASAALRRNHLPDLGVLRDVLILYKEAGYALAGSLRRSSSFLRNVEPPLPETEGRFRVAASVLQTRARALSHLAGRIAEAESVFDRVGQRGDGLASLAETGQLLESVARNLNEAAREEEQLDLWSALRQVGHVLSLAGSHLAAQNSTEAARLMEELARDLFMPVPGYVTA